MYKALMVRVQDGEQLLKQSMIELLTLPAACSLVALTTKYETEAVSHQKTHGRARAATPQRWSYRPRPPRASSVPLPPPDRRSVPPRL